MEIQPVILAGGSGTRLWPLSRESMPKQFLPLLDGVSPFQETLRRLAGIEDAAPPVVVASEEHRFLVADQLRAEGVPAVVYLEPCARGTAPALAVAAHHAARRDPQAILLALPSDHD